MIRSLLILIVFVGASISRAACEPTVAKVTLRAESEVRSAQPVKLKDIATIQAPGKLADQIRNIVVGTGPLPGTRMTIDAGYIKLKLNSCAADGSIAIHGPGSIGVTGKCARISPQTLADRARQFLLSQTPRDGRTYDVTIDRLPRELVLSDASAVEIKPRIAGSSARLGPNTVLLDAVVDGRTAATTSAALRLAASANVLVVTAVIRQGEALTGSNTTWEMRDVTRIPTAIVQTESSEAQDWIARRLLAPGKIVTPVDVALPPAVRKGETVALTVRCGKVTLRASGEAQQAGRVGESISVRTLISKEDVRARITAPGQVEIVR